MNGHLHLTGGGEGLSAWTENLSTHRVATHLLAGAYSRATGILWTET